jgi:hypothetical protein
MYSFRFGRLSLQFYLIEIRLGPNYSLYRYLKIIYFLAVEKRSVWGQLGAQTNTVQIKYLEMLNNN